MDGGAILGALITSLLIPAMYEMWKRRHKSHPDAAESIIFGLLILGAGVAAFYFMLQLPFEVESFFGTMLLIIFKIALILVGLYGLMVGGVVAWDGVTRTSEPPEKP